LTPTVIPTGLHCVGAFSSGGFGGIRYHTMIRKLLDTDASVRDYLEGETTTLPEFYRSRIRRELGPMYQHLPAGAILHDQNAYLQTVKEEPALAPVPLRARRVG